ncbi:MAG: hypothetical protein RLZZ387_3890 [Chloroflexota bacterium]
MADSHIPLALPIPDESLPAPRSRIAAEPSAVVGMGASAGGLEAFTTFFQQMPPDSGMAFVLIQHLDPNQPSLLPELLASQAAIPVRAAADGMTVEPDRVYVIPPNATLMITQGVLSLVTPAEAHGHRMPIDRFFQSLAADQGTRAIGIILSGADTDGTLGLAAIQDAGGLTLAQAPETARFAIMPHSAISRRVVDHVLPVAEMPALLRSYVARRLAAGPPYNDGAPAQSGAELRAICAILQRVTGHDFRQYKPATLLRRIARRMQIAHLADLGAYAERLAHDRPEVDQLFQDLLISVTSFFRDPAAFDTLATDVIPTLLRDKDADTPLRIWIAGCATGEEAYTVAMLVLEQLDHSGTSPPVQLFATDIDERALAVARQGRYDAESTTHISAERLARFFVPDGDGYQVATELRECCLFSAHNLISDPPFARMDLLVCRNLLIYFTADLQRQLVPLLHYALAPGGYLMLGSAESVTSYPELFRAVNQPQRIYQRNEVHARPTIPFPLALPGRQPSRGLVTPRRSVKSAAVDLSTALERLMLQDYAPPAVVVDAQGTIVSFFGRTGPYLEPKAGTSSLDTQAIVRPELRLPLQAAIRAARRDRTPVRSDITIPGANGAEQLTLVARPLSELAPEAGLVLILFQRHDQLSSPVVEPADVGMPSMQVAAQLADELHTTRAALEATIADLQEANAELTTANEELVATNEELQSANEELQTSKEEIQSINEELKTVNAELHRKITELDRVNADLANLFTSTQIPAIFLHADGRIARFTPAATELFRLLPVDVGRPITDIASRFHDGDLLALVDGVLESLQPHEETIHRVEPQAWWIMRIRPYRTLANVIDGVVVTFTDITGLTKASAERECLMAETQAARIYAEQIVATVVEPLLVLDEDLRVQLANPAYYQQFATTVAETEGRTFYYLGGGIWDLPELHVQLDALREQQRDVVDLEITQVIPSRGMRTLRLWARPIAHRVGDTRRILLAITDITELTRAATLLQADRDALERRVDERTRELAAVNATLEAEVAGHRRSEQQRQQLIQHLVTAQEEERRRVARELHDQLGQDVAGLILGLKALQDQVAIHAPAHERVRQLQSLAVQIGQEVRTLAVRLRPAVLDDLGLSVALANYVEQWSARAAVAADLHTTGLEGPRLPLAVESTLYRLVQETLTNILKYAQASGVSLIIERTPVEVRLIVEDDGVGFDVAAVRAGAQAEQRLGLVGMEERVTQLGGTLTIESTPGHGTTVFVSLPLLSEMPGANT